MSKALPVIFLLALISSLTLACTPTAPKTSTNTPNTDLHDLYAQILANPESAIQTYANTVLLVHAAPVQALTHPNTVLIAHPPGDPIPLHFNKDQQTAGLQPGMTIRVLCTAKKKGPFKKELVLKNCRWNPANAIGLHPIHPPPEPPQ